MKTKFLQFECKNQTNIFFFLLKEKAQKCTLNTIKEEYPYN